MEIQTLDQLKTKEWWSFLAENQKDLLEQSLVLLEREEHLGEGMFHDYAFVVFPAAKAYEGFLKTLFLLLGLIGKIDFEGDRFRIGRALNPTLPERFRGHDWVYGLLSKIYPDDTPDYLWMVWKRSRNLLFHWFPGHKNFITLAEAQDRLSLIINAIDRAYSIRLKN